MRLPYRFSLAVMFFMVNGLVGPLIRLMAWPPQSVENLTSHNFSGYVYHLVILLWPAQLLGVMEASSGRFVAATVSVSINVMLFGFVGVVAGALMDSRYRLFSLYLFVCTLTSLFALWGAGFSIAYLNLFALSTAIMIHAVPFIATYFVQQGE